MKKYNLIVIGTGSAMNLIEPYLHHRPDAAIAVVDKDEPGGICLNKGCIPTKMLLYPADCVREVEHFRHLGVDAKINIVRFGSIMERMRLHIFTEMNSIRENLKNTDILDYYQAQARFIEPGVLDLGKERVKGETIFLCTGSRPLIPPVDGLDKTGYLTSDTVLDLETLPKRLAIIGGGYIAAEYGHFFSAMGSEVTIIGRNPQFLKDEEPEISTVAQTELSAYMTIRTNAEVIRTENKKGGKHVTARDRKSGEIFTITADEILVAAGRRSNSDLLDPEAGGIETDKNGWIKVDEHLRTSRPNVWALGDATGKHLFKHAANYESEILYHNAVADHDEPAAVDYHAVPHAVFTYPEIASVGMGEEEAAAAFDEENVLIGIEKYGSTAKGIAMGLEQSNYFVKVILKNGTGEILGAHIVGPQASVLIQEIINCMYSPRNRFPFDAMHIHPALSEVVQRAFSNLMTAHDYRHHLINDH